VNKRMPKHAWVRYLGYRMIEEISLIVDGEEFDLQDGELMLLLHKLFDDVEHNRGDDIMLGNIDEMTEISSHPRPAMRLYIKLFLFFSKHYGCSLPLINMLYSDIRLKIKLRKQEDLLYIDKHGKLAKPLIIKCQLLGNYIFLGDEERKTLATKKTECLMERFMSGSDQKKTIRDVENNIQTNEGATDNLIRLQYIFSGPCKYFIWKITLQNNISNPTDILYWDLCNYRPRKPNGEIDINANPVNLIKRMSLLLNNVTREEWKDADYFQLLQPHSRYINSLDSGEYFYAFCIFPKLIQPSGSTNLSYIDDTQFMIQLTDEAIDQLKMCESSISIKMWECSYNVFVALSGFGALLFYGSGRT
jgi:hypothetical protein